MAAGGNARIQVLHEAIEPGDDPFGWLLCFQWCRYVYDNGSLEEGYRFIWRHPDPSGKRAGKLQAARGQARIPSMQKAKRLMDIAKKAGWGDLEG